MKPSKGMWTECRTLSEKDYQGKKDDKDEKSQKLSALKTAMCLFSFCIYSVEEQKVRISQNRKL